MKLPQLPAISTLSRLYETTSHENDLTEAVSKKLETVGKKMNRAEGLTSVTNFSGAKRLDEKTMSETKLMSLVRAMTVSEETAN